MRSIRVLYVVYLVVILIGIVYCTAVGLLGR
jgi:hypothetical protein